MPIQPFNRIAHWAFSSSAPLRPPPRKRYKTWTQRSHSATATSIEGLFSASKTPGRASPSRSPASYRMAKSEYEYVEDDDKLDRSNWIVVRINGCRFRRFSSIHEFEKPNDSSALDLMNYCASLMPEHFPDIVFAYGASDNYSFLLSEKSQFYDRRASKIISLSVSYFISAYVMNWKKFFPNKDLKKLPYFDARALPYPRATKIREYLTSRQEYCHKKNLHDTCFWMLVKSGKTQKEANLCLKDAKEKDKNEMLFQQFGINYNKLPEMFRKGSCVFRNEAEQVVKTDKDGNPVKRLKKILTIAHVDTKGPKFWDEHPHILQED